MKNEKLTAIITTLANNFGITKFRVDSMKLTEGDFEVTPQGELTYDKFIEVKILPLAGYHEIPITFSIKREKNEC